MTARAMWKASLDIAGMQLPVKLYAAVEDRDVHFRLLHAKDKSPVKQRIVDPRTDKEVPPDAIQRAVALEPGVFVVITPEEMAQEAPMPVRTIDVTRFVPRAAIDSAWFLRPYFLGPDGSGADYAALLEGLGTSKLCGIARWSMRGKRYFGALEARDRHLALITMRSAEEVVAAKHLPVPTGGEVRAAERGLAEQLLAALDGPFDPSALKDEYRDRLLAYLDAKARGRRVVSARETSPKASPDLARALAQSLQALKKRRAA